jgi:FkbM family methyltransferase
VSVSQRKETLQAWLATATANRAVATSLRVLTRRGLLPPEIWGRLPVSKVFRVQLPDTSGFLYASSPADFIGRSVYWRGLSGYEPETIPVFVQLARRARVVLDIGAHTGFFSLVALSANTDSRVVAFEPVPRIFQRLQEQIDLNGWTARCDARNLAVANHSGTTTFHVPTGELPYSASMDPNGFWGVPGDLIEVPVVTIDAALAGVEGIDLVKIDVEGFEDQVLDGMRQVLEDSTPNLLFESIPGNPVATVEALLGRFGYRFYTLTHAGAVPARTIAAGPAERARNVLAAVPGRAKGIVPDGD